MHAPGHRRARRDLGAVPRLHAHRPRPDFAWTLTSAGADIIDQFVETLCGGSDTQVRASRASAATMGPSTPAPQGRAGSRTRRHVPHDRPRPGRRLRERRRHARSAISSKRSSYGKDIARPAVLRDISPGKVQHARSRSTRGGRARRRRSTSFYADDKHIAEVHRGPAAACAPSDVDPRPADERRRQPRVEGLPRGRARTRSRSTRRAGQIVNWNNKAAPRLRRRRQRVELRLGPPRATCSTRTSPAQEEARPGVGDVGDERGGDAGPPGDRHVPRARRACCHGAPAPSPRAQQMLDADRPWRAQGGSRLDRDLDGKIDAARRGDHGRGLDRRSPTPSWGRCSGRSSPSSRRSRALRTAARRVQPAAGTHVRRQGPARRCWATKSDSVHRRGTAAPATSRRCRHVAVGGDRRGGQRARSRAGHGDPAAWRATRTRSGSRSRPGLLTTTLRYTNRPTGIQQVISFKGHRAGAVTASAARRPWSACARSASRCRRPPSARATGSPAWFVRGKRSLRDVPRRPPRRRRLALWCAAPEGMQHALVAVTGGESAARRRAPWVDRRAPRPRTAVGRDHRARSRTRWLSVARRPTPSGRRGRSRRPPRR